jgi:hypothetical protein
MTILRKKLSLPIFIVAVLVSFPSHLQPRCIGPRSGHKTPPSSFKARTLSGSGR